VNEMGGSKKKTMKQMERTHKTKGEPPKGGKAAPAEKKAAVKAVRADEESVLKEIAKVKVSTPSALAAQLGVKVSYAKQLLEELAQKRSVELVSSCSRLRIYKPVSAA
jgi:ribosomal protein S25